MIVGSQAADRGVGLSAYCNDWRCNMMVTLGFAFAVVGVVLLGILYLLHDGQRRLSTLEKRKGGL